LSQPASPIPARLVYRKIALPERDWYDLGVQAAIERKPGRGDLIRRAVTLYLEGIRKQRTQASPNEE